MASTQSEISALLDSRSEAVRIKDIDRLMSFYSPDIVLFDVVPGLQYTGSAALRPRVLEWFDGFRSFDQEVRDLNILASADIAVAYVLVRAGVTLKLGARSDIGYGQPVAANGQITGGWLRTNMSHCRLTLRAGVRPWTLCPN
jgi:ketosteroid isomerase-like protein